MKLIILVLTIFILLFLEMECTGIYKTIFPNLYENQFIKYQEESKIIDDFNLFDTLKTCFDDILSNRLYNINEKYAELGFVLFNEKGNKAIIFYYEHDDYMNSNGFDYIHIIAAFFNGKTWVFETNNTPTLGLNRKDLNQGKPFKFKKIREVNKNEILKSKFICSFLKGVNFSYVDNAFYIKNLVEN